MSITGQPGHVGTELRFWLRAPGRTRTCDPLLRRQLLYPTELRAPGTTLCMPKVTRRPHAGWLSVAADRARRHLPEGMPGPPHQRTPGQGTTRTLSSVPGEFQHLTLPHQAQSGGKLRSARWPVSFTGFDDTLAVAAVKAGRGAPDRQECDFSTIAIVLRQVHLFRAKYFMGRRAGVHWR